MRIQKKKTLSGLPSFTQRLLTGLNQSLLGLSRYLQRKTISYSDAKKKRLLFLFCGVFVSVSVLLIITSLERKYLNAYSVTPIKTIPLIENKILHRDISDGEFKQILRYKRYLDSLPAQSRDSLLMKTPNLEDTINYLEALYRKQIKK